MAAGAARFSPRNSRCSDHDGPLMPSTELRNILLWKKEHGHADLQACKAEAEEYSKRQECDRRDIGSREE